MLILTVKVDRAVGMEADGRRVRSGQRRPLWSGGRGGEAERHDQMPPFILFVVLDGSVFLDRVLGGRCKTDELDAVALAGAVPPTPARPRRGPLRPFRVQVDDGDLEVGVLRERRAGEGRARQRKAHPGEAQRVGVPRVRVAAERARVAPGEPLPAGRGGGRRVEPHRLHPLGRSHGQLPRCRLRHVAARPGVAERARPPQRRRRRGLGLGPRRRHREHELRPPVLRRLGHQPRVVGPLERALLRAAARATVPRVDAGVVLVLVQLLEPEPHAAAGGVVPHVELRQPGARRRLRNGRRGNFWQRRRRITGQAPTPVHQKHDRDQRRDGEPDGEQQLKPQRRHTARTFLPLLLTEKTGAASMERRRTWTWSRITMLFVVRPVDSFCVLLLWRSWSLVWWRVSEGWRGHGTLTASTKNRQNNDWRGFKLGGSRTHRRDAAGVGLFCSGVDRIGAYLQRAHQHVARCGLGW
jgi:hypothetical protein